MENPFRYMLFHDPVTLRSLLEAAQEPDLQAGDFDLLQPTSTMGTADLSWSDYSNRRKTTNSPRLQSDTSYHCTKCNKVLRNYRCFKTHLADHAGIKKHICGTCGYGSNYHCNFKRHLVAKNHVRADE